MSELIRPGRLYYYDDFPAWLIRVAQPSRFADARLTAEFATFSLPTASLAACIVRLYDIPDQPFYVHRVFDLTDEGVNEYALRSVEKGHWVLEIQGGGEDRGVFRLLDLAESGCARSFEAVREANRTSGGDLDGEKAMDGFLEAFEPAAKESGWEAGWDAVRNKFKLKR